MCGIAGFFQSHFDFTAYPIWEERLYRMKNSLLHRGPDANDLVLFPHAGLAHTRLSIIDLACGNQPMSGNYQGHLATIVYNGELYNTRELRRMLEPFSISYQTTSDTEVILYGYLTMGEAFFRQLNGIFAFSIYDRTKDCMLLIRDRLGVKPLFYQMHEDVLVFGSEPKALFAYGIKPALDKKSWGEILGLGPAHTLGCGVYANMKELLPGHYMLLQNGALQDFNYWTLEAKEHTDSYYDTVEKVSWLVKDSVCRQMVSDIPICTFLSGGLDSSLVSAICARELAKSGEQLTTYSFDFAGNRENFKPNAFQSSEDRPFVEKMVSHINSRHIYLECNNETQADYLYKAVDARDMPCMADVESSMLYFCSLVAKQHRVTLTGECADEIFGGYPWFHRKELWDRKHFPWSYDMEARSALFQDDFLAETDFAAYAQAAYDNSIAETPRLESDTPEEKRRREIAWLNVRWFMMTLLNRMDRTSMYSGLEARVPYADHRILEYVFNIPWDMKCRDGVTKSLLLECGKDLLPDTVLHRKKSPYPKTYDPGYEQLLKARLLDLVNTPSAPINTILDHKKLERFLSVPSDYGRPWYGQLMAGPQMLAYLLQINYWMTTYHLSV